MPNWKKVIVSGSNAVLNNITASNSIFNGDSSQPVVIISGSQNSFFGSNISTDKLRIGGNLDESFTFKYNTSVPVFGGGSIPPLLQISGSGGSGLFNPNIILGNATSIDPIKGDNVIVPFSFYVGSRFTSPDNQSNTKGAYQFLISGSDGNGGGGVISLGKHGIDPSGSSDIFLNGHVQAAGHITASGNLSGSGTATASYGLFTGSFQGDGSQLTGLNLQTVTDNGATTTNQVQFNDGINFSNDVIMKFDSSNSELIINEGDEDITPVIRHFGGSISSSFNENDFSTNGKIITTEVESATDFLLDVEGDITLDANGADILLKDNNVAFGRFKRDSSNFVIKSEGKNKDIIFKGNDNSIPITSLILDMSDGGKALFKGGAEITGSLKVTGSFEAQSGTSLLNFETGISTGSADGKLSITSTGGSANISLHRTDGLQAALLAGTTSVGFHYDENGKFAIGPANNPATASAFQTPTSFVMDSAGKVGINTQTPDARLAVVGKIKTSVGLESGAYITASSYIKAGSYIQTDSHITASGNISASGTIIANAFTSVGNLTVDGISFLNDNVSVDGDISADGNVSAPTFTGTLTGTSTGLSGAPDIIVTNLTVNGSSSFAAPITSSATTILSGSGNIIASNITASNAFHAQAHSGFEFTISGSQFNMINQSENKSLFFKTSPGLGTINFGTNGNDSGVIVGPGNGNITASGDVRLSNGILSIPQFPNVSASLASLSSSLAVAPGTGNFKIESQSVFLGTNAGENQTAGLNPVTLVFPTSSENVGIGHQALQDITNGTNNVAIGYNVLSKNSTGFNNVAISKGALGNFTGSNTSIGIGFDAGAPYDDNSPEGGHIGNTIMGHQALNDFNIKSTAEISNNTAIGLRALRGLGGTTDPSFVNNVKNNTAIGRQAGLNIVHGTGGALNHNTFLGNSAGMNATPQQGNMLSNLLLGARAGMSGYIGSNNVVLQTATGDTALGNEGWGVSENISIGGRGALYSDNNIIISNASSSVTNTIGASDINTETKAINQSSNVIIGGYSNIISNVTNKTSRDNSIINSSTITIGGSTSTVSADDNFVGSAKGIIVQGDRNVLLGVELTDLDETQFFVGDKNTVINSTGFQLSNSTKQNTIIGSTGIEVANSTGKNAALHSQTIDFANSYENISIKSINTSYTGSNKSVALLDSNSHISGDSSVLINTTNITDDGSDNTYIGGSNHTIVGSSISGNIFIGGNNQTATGNGNDNIFLGATGGETSGSNNIVAGNTNYLGTNLKYSFIHGAQHNVRPHNASQRNIVVGFQHTFATGPAETITNSFIGGNRLMISSSNSFGYGKGLHIAYDNMGAFGKFNDSTANDASGSLFTVGCGPSTTIRRNAMNVVSATVNGSGNKAVVYLDQLVDFDFANDTAAAAAGIGVGGLYHTEGTVKIRTS